MEDLEAAFNEYIDHYEQRRQNESCEFRMSPDDARLIEQVAELKQTVDSAQATEEPSEETGQQIEEPQGSI